MSSENVTTPEQVMNAIPTYTPTPPSVPSEIVQWQPGCPLCKAPLYPVRENDARDLLLECLNDGYEAVYRCATRDFEPRPGREEKRWAPPLFEVSRG